MHMNAGTVTVERCVFDSMGESDAVRVCGATCVIGRRRLYTGDGTGTTKQSTISSKQACVQGANTGCGGSEGCSCACWGRWWVGEAHVESPHCGRWVPCSACGMRARMQVWGMTTMVCAAWVGIMRRGVPPCITWRTLGCAALVPPLTAALAGAWWREGAGHRTWTAARRFGDEEEAAALQRERRQRCRRSNDAPKAGCGVSLVCMGDAVGDSQGAAVEVHAEQLG